MATDYTYIVSRLRAIEASMPDAGWFQRLARTKEESLLGSLRELYRGFDQIESLHDFEDALEAEKGAKLELISSLLPDRRDDSFIRSGYDFDNMVHYWKARKLGREPYLSGFGLVQVEEIEKAVATGNLTWLPQHLKDLHDKLQSVDGSQGPEVTEYAGESAKWEYLLENSPTGRAEEYVRFKIDLANIKTFIRLKRTRLRKEITDLIWIGGGGIDAATFNELMKEPEDELFTYLHVSSYRGLVSSGMSVSTPLWRVDSMLRLELLERIGESRYRFFDIVPVLYHLELQERDSNILRIIITGRLNRLPDEMLLERAEALLP